MKDLIETILKGLVAYLPVLVSIVATPRESIRKLIRDEPDALHRALSFCGLTLAIGFVLQAPLAQSEQDFTSYAGSMLVFIPAIGEFVVPTLLGGPDTLMIGRVLWSEFFNNRDWPVASAVAMAMLVLLVLPVMWLRRAQSQQEAG